MQAVRVLDYLSSVPLFRHVSQEKVARIREHPGETDLESGVMSACPGDATYGLEIDGLSGLELHAETSN